MIPKSSTNSSSKEVEKVAISDNNGSLRESNASIGDLQTPKSALEKVWRKLDTVILPTVTMFYLLSFLDRSNISNARVAGLQTDLRMTNRQYSMVLTTTYIPYIVAELPSNLLLKRIGPNIMLPTMITLWGIVTTMQGLVHNYSGLLVCRFFLGLLEGGLFPGVVLYLSFFYPRNRLQIRISTFFASASLSGAFSGLLAFGIIHMDGKGARPGWSWIFILEGIFTVLFGIFSYFVLPGSPSHTPFLTDSEREYVISVLRQDGAISKNGDADEFKWIEVWRCLKLPHVWFLAVAFFCNGTILYSLAYFEPSIVQGLGYTAARAQLMSVPPFATAFAFSTVASLVSDRYGCRGLTSMLLSIFCIIGFSLFLTAKTTSTRYGSLFFSITGVYSSAPALATWHANNVTPHIRRATAVAIAFIMTNAGGILATWLMGSLSPAPRYTKATITFLIFSVVMLLFSVINLVYLWWQNRHKANIRKSSLAEDEPESLGDRSAWFIYSL